MHKRNITSTVKRLVSVIALSLLPLIGKADEDAQPAADCPMTSSGAQTDVGEQPFENLQARSQHFAEELGRLKGEGLTISSEQLVEQANAEKTYRVETQAGSNEKLSPETVYARSRSGVVVLGGIFKCDKCQQWHAQCASGFVVGKEGLILTNLHVVESFKKLEATGAMTHDGRVFPLKAVLAANRLNDLALLKLGI